MQEHHVIACLCHMHRDRGSYAHAHTHTRAHTRTHAHRTHAHTHTRTHAHTHTRFLPKQVHQFGSCWHQPTHSDNNRLTATAGRAGPTPPLSPTTGALPVRLRGLLRVMRRISAAGAWCCGWWGGSDATAEASTEQRRTAAWVEDAILSLRKNVQWCVDIIQIYSKYL